MNKNRLMQQYKKQNRYVRELTDHVIGMDDVVDTIKDGLDTVTNEINKVKDITEVNATNIVDIKVELVDMNIELTDIKTDITKIKDAVTEPGG